MTRLHRRWPHTGSQRDIPCRTVLLQRSDEGTDEELDGLCLLLEYRVQSWGAQISSATYTSWREVEGYLEPSEGN